LQEIWDLILGNFVGVLVVLARVMGIFTFNPILSRGTVPMRVRMSMSVVLTLVMVAHITGGNDVVGYIPTSIPGFVGVLVMEAALGFVFGFVVNLILAAIILAGKVIDNQMTLALAELMDPAMGFSMPITANLYYYMAVMYFFLVGGHLNYIQLFALSYEIIPIGFEVTAAWHELTYVIVMFFGAIFTLAIKMAMPIIAAEMILQVCVGVIMKAVPNIQIFVINIQMKVLMGIFVLMMIAGPMSDYIQNLLDIMFENLYAIMYSLG
jgi:flagellar biosynthetic protein FliR